MEAKKGFQMKKQLNVLVTIDEYKKLKDDLLKLSIYFNRRITFSSIVKRLIENSLTPANLYKIGIITDLEFHKLSNLSYIKEKNKEYARLKKLNNHSFKYTRLKPDYLQPKKTDRYFSDRLKSFMSDDEKLKYQEYLEYKSLTNA